MHKGVGRWALGPIYAWQRGVARDMDDTDCDRITCTPYIVIGGIIGTCYRQQPHLELHEPNIVLICP